MTHTRTRTVMGVLLAAISALQCHTVPMVSDARMPVVRRAETAEATLASVELTDLARRDPVEFLHVCRETYERNDIRDYTCTFVKQELLDDGITKPQRIEVRFREAPFSVDMRWVANAGPATRALYVEDAWFDKDGRRLAWFKPSGSLIRLVVPKIQQPIDGDRVRADSRRTIDQFGFAQTLDLIDKFVQKGLDDGVLDLKYVGTGSVEGRPTLVFERRLPYTGEEIPYPDALLRYHIDQEWLVPTACYSYADPKGKSLLGSYVLTDVRFNVGLDDDDFNPKTNGF